MIIKNSLLGAGLSGSMDGLILYERNGRLCGRRKPLDVKRPSAPGQVAQQARVASVAIFYQSLKDAGIYPYWKLAAKGKVQSGYNLLMMRNLKAFNGEGRICDFPKLRITEGEVALPDGLQVRKAEEGTWTVEWMNTPHQAGTSPDDRLRLYVMKDSETFAVKPVECGETCREDGTATFRLAGELEDYGHLYVVFVSCDGRGCR